jgi:hypothetical protein
VLSVLDRVIYSPATSFFFSCLLPLFTRIWITRLQLNLTFLQRRLWRVSCYLLGCNAVLATFRRNVLHVLAWMKNKPCKKPCFLLASSLAYLWPWWWRPWRSSEMLVDFYRTTWRCIPESSINHECLVQWVLGCLYRGLKRPDREAYHSPYLVARSRLVELYPQSSLRLHGVVLN